MMKVTTVEDRDPARCTHPNESLHVGRFDGSVTVCLRCRSQVAIKSTRRRRPRSCRRASARQLGADPRDRAGGAGLGSALLTAGERVKMIVARFAGALRLKCTFCLGRELRVEVSSREVDGRTVAEVALSCGACGDRAAGKLVAQHGLVLVGCHADAESEPEGGR